jgi:SH3-like domain-containing protein
VDLAATADYKSTREHEIRVASDSLRLRNFASEDAEVVLLIPKGSAVELVEEVEGWCRVRVMNFATGELIEGWVAAEFLRDWPNAGQKSPVNPCHPAD